MKAFLFHFALLFSTVLFGQTQEEPVVWDTAMQKISDSEYELIFKAKIFKDWHLYSQYNPENASLPILISGVGEAVQFKLIGKAKESQTFKEYSPIWEKEERFFKDSATLTQRIQISDPAVKRIRVSLEGQVCKEVCLQIEETFSFYFNGVSTKEMSPDFVDEKSKQQTSALKLHLKNTEILKNTLNDENLKAKNFLSIFLLGFVGGLLALLTPCVFPMIPLTVSFFTKQSQNKAKGIRNALLYGVFIVLVYVLLSLPFHFLDSINPEILNTISTNVWLNVLFFVILVLFAFSFFGYYEITLPSSWGNKMDDASNIGGILGTFFMALTLAIVSFSCTGPILGSLLAGSLSSDAGAMQLSVGMSSFGLALALPFALFALFPRWLNSLPKSGGWLNTTKVVLGFLELAFAFKFLSNADLVVHWGLLKREVFIGIWVLLFAGMALYLFKRIKFPRDGSDKRLTFSRISTGVLVVAFTVYLIPGILKTPAPTLNLLSGFLPPGFYSIYPQKNDCPLGLNCYKDFKIGLAAAKKENKPILLDFTGWACVNCRKVEENVWSEPAIYQLLKNEYILISLYVDDRKELPVQEQFLFLKPNGKTKQIKTIGDKWATFQVVNFQTASQPYYIQMTPDLKLLHRAKQYTDKATYYNWLREGKSKFDNEVKMDNSYTNF